jgi:hypothetical protein
MYLRVKTDVLYIYLRVKTDVLYMYLRVKTDVRMAYWHRPLRRLRLGFPRDKDGVGIHLAERREG